MFKIIHISDFHLESEKISLDKTNLIKSWIIDIKKYVDESTIIVFTGDAIDKGGAGFSDSVNPFNVFSETLFAPVIEAYPFLKNKIFIVPGNHDVQRSRINNMEDKGLKSTLKENYSEINQIIKNNKITKDRLARYLEFEEAFYSSYQMGDLSNNMHRTVQLEINKIKIGISCINSSFFCKDDTDFGNICVGKSQIESSLLGIDNCGVKICIFHHPINYLIESDIEEIKPLIYSNYDILLTGHTHKLEGSYNQDFDGNIYSSIGKSFTSEPSKTINLQTGYSVIEYDLGNSIKIHSRKYLNTPKNFVANTDIGTEDGIKIISITKDPQKEVIEELSEKINFDNNKKDVIKDVVKIGIFLPNPIDREFDLKFDEILDCFSRFEVSVDCNYLSIDSIRDSEVYDYIFIFTNLIKDKFLIEDGYLRSKYVGINELLDEFNFEKALFVAIFYKGDSDVESSIIEKPIFLINISLQSIKEALNTFTYKIFTGNNAEKAINSFKIINSALYQHQPLRKGVCVKQKYNPKISKSIDKKQILKFVGRKTDLESIIRKIHEIRFESKILTIKGSGGIGKTTIAIKCAIELAYRRNFSQGVFFISCNSISNFENFYFQISQCFDLMSSINLQEQISETISEKNRLIILDNFETLLHIQEGNEIKQLVSFICEYCTIIITTRQVLDLENEDVYELRNLTTDEGVQLFKTFYSGVKESEEKVLRNEIVENILNNNPLAIKIIARGLPSSKNLHQLSDELNENLFKGEDVDKIFESPEDYNIEKSKSIYYSIYYSYDRLTPKEKLAFELLSIFPDGIHMENFKNFSKAPTKTPNSKENKFEIDDREIKSLDSKSLLENFNEHLKLQSILNRFADFQFKKREESQKSIYYFHAYSYNLFIINLSESSIFDSKIGILLSDMNTNNFIKIIEVLEYINIPVTDKILFVNSVSDVFRQTNQHVNFLKKVESIKQLLATDRHNKMLLELIEINLLYWIEDFDHTYDKLQKTLPFNSMLKLDITDPIQYKIMIHAFSIYKHEGMVKKLLEFVIKNPKFNIEIESTIFELGFFAEYENLLKYKDDIDFFDYEYKYASETLTQNELKKHINSIYKKRTLEIVQSTYLLAKAFNCVKESDIKKLVITNPYTKGLIKLMLALAEGEEVKKCALFQEAINNLIHIKYYYTEAILLYCRYLKSIHNSDYNKWFRIGKGIAIKYYFRYLIHCYENLDKERTDPYKQDSCESIVSIDGFESFISNLIRKKKKKGK